MPSLDQTTHFVRQVCVECEKDVAALRKFAAFLPSLRVQRKITVFYDLFHKLQVNIAECIGAFGLFVKSFVENDLVGTGCVCVCVSLLLFWLKSLRSQEGSLH